VAELKTQDFEAQLAELSRDPRDPRLGFVGPRSLSWRMDGDLVLHAAGPRALLMQLAHPMVAQGVADHSNFETDPLGRTLRTFQAVYRLVFGTRQEALEVARRIHHIHTHVRGTLPHTTGAHLAGTPYAANDPVLLAWVWATLIDSARYAYETFIRPLRPVEIATWYNESRYPGRLFGLPANAYPDRYEGFREWMDGYVASPEIGVSPTARRVVEVFLRGPRSFHQLGSVFHVLAAGTLPPRLRSEFGLRWDFVARAAFRSMRIAIRSAARVTPLPLRTVPTRIRAEWRCRRLVAAPVP
jgi:uncharacterized protein (DUF2236 family)